MSDSRIPLILVGAGGHAKSVISTIVDSPDYRIAGLIDDGFAAMPKEILGFPVLGGRDVLPGLRAQGIIHTHVCIGDNRVRGQMSDWLRLEGFDVVSLRHPSNFVGIGSQYGAGSFFHVYSLLGAECIAGEGCILQPYSDVGHETRMGKYVQLCPGIHTGGNCEIGDYAFIGLGAVILPGVRIGQNAIVGANSVVREDIPDNGVVVGNPGRLIKIRDVPVYPGPAAVA
ncbi:acetyltransferase [Halopseudomonas sp.]|uniref:acetyltransferase n=1 Tax=Halopseudomonas sp. TaxID=2901191 RepID=UPI00300127DF